MNDINDASTHLYLLRVFVSTILLLCVTLNYSFLVPEGTVANVVFVAFACEANQLKVQQSVVYQKCRNYSNNLVYST